SSRLSHPNRLDVDELADAVGGELPPVAGALQAAKGEPRIAFDHAVDEDAAGLDLVDETLLFGGIVGPHRGAQAVAGAIGQSDGLFERAVAEEARDRTEDLLLGARAPGRHVREHGRSVKVAGPIEWPAAQKQPRAAGDRLLDLSVHVFADLP